MRILIVDDEMPVRIMLRETLRCEGFAVDSTGDGDEGMRLALLNEYDCILLDNRLPRRSGIEIVREVRAAGRTTPILILSVLTNTRYKAELLNAGADDYLEKPYSHEELLARIRALLRRGKMLTADVLTVDDLTLDVNAHTVRRGKRDIILTNKEFALLEYLMRNMGTVLTRGMLIEHVWSMDIDPFSNTIESHIASLRKKVEWRGKLKLIHTVSGRGYKIED